MMRYFRRRWEDRPPSPYESWGYSWWYFEIDETGYPLRQIEQYDNGYVFKYDEQNPLGDYGGLGDQALEDLTEWAIFEIAADEFEQAWSKLGN